MDNQDIGPTLRALRDLAPSDITDTLARLARTLGTYDITVYLIDFEQSTLVPVPDRSAHVDSPIALTTQGSTEGSAFVSRRIASESQHDITRVCVPILEGSDYTGVLAFTIRGGLDDEKAARCEELGMLTGATIAVAARYTDLFNLVRRRKAMTLQASIQWDLLPPLRLKTPEAVSMGVLEPAYDVGGDFFDHAVNGFALDLAVMDSMGHGLASSVVSSLAVGVYRHDRREGQLISAIHRHLDQVLGEQFGGERFVTGQLAQLDLQTGHLTWTNAGHPRPLHVRRGVVIDSLPCRPSLPWGLGGHNVEVAELALQPGDSVVFYTDGVVEGRLQTSEPFGLDRFVDLIERSIAASTPTDVILRSAVNTILDYQDRRLRDDATILWATWLPQSAA